jgi:hypothetical protein
LRIGLQKPHFEPRKEATGIVSTALREEYNQAPGI